MLGKIKGVDEVNVELQTVVPQVEVDVDLAKAAAYGIKPGDVRRAAATIMAGEEVGDIFRDNKTYDVQVWSIPSARASVDDIRNVLVDTPNGPDPPRRRRHGDGPADRQLHQARERRAPPRRRRRRRRAATSGRCPGTWRRG